MVHVIENNVWQVGILPETGASVAFGRVRRGGAWLDVMRPTPAESYHLSAACASYVLIPWSNRIRAGVFRFRGVEHRLRIDTKDGNAIHGVARDFGWKIEAADGTSIELSFRSGEHANINFPWRFSARVRYWLEGERFLTATTVKNEDGAAFPAGFGHHPYFVRNLAGRADDEAQVEIPCRRYFVLEKCLPSAGPVPIVAGLDFRTLRNLGPMLIDDCLTGREAGKPVRIIYSRGGLALRMDCDALFENIILYAPPGKPFFAVEPVTNANDGFNLFEQGIAGSGVFVLEPGQERSGTFSLKVEQTPG